VAICFSKAVGDAEVKWAVTVGSKTPGRTLVHALPRLPFYEGGRNARAGQFGYDLA
jgi:hypothetical protein